MIVVAWFGVLLGGVVFHLSARAISQANAGRRLPYWRNPEIASAPAIALRVAGVFLAALSTSFLAPAIGYWSVAVIALALLPGLAVLPLHNRRLAASI